MTKGGDGEERQSAFHRPTLEERMVAADHAPDRIGALSRLLGLGHDRYVNGLIYRTLLGLAPVVRMDDLRAFLAGSEDDDRP